MIKISTISALGIIVALIPFSGFPNDNALPVKNILYIVCGLLITVLAVLIRRELEEVVKHLHNEVIKTDTFTESVPKRRRKTDR
jgi:sulfite exporter TauE/SafE